jgi:hypothetical protein
MGGGISSGRPMKPGTVGVGPIAWITATGDWKKIRCDEDQPAKCKDFDREYLSKPHTYTVVSADGKGASVHVERMTLDDECFGYGGPGTFSGGPIRYAAVATESTNIFANGDAAQSLAEQEAEPVRKALAAVVGNKLDSMKDLRVYSIRMEGQSLLVIQRAFQDYVDKPSYDPHKEVYEIFAIGKMDQGRFHLLIWKENTVDENEQILGFIHLKNRRDFLVNTISHPEGDFFRIYGIREGKLALIFEGGGGGC